jgi:cold shock CspA family protein
VQLARVIDITAAASIGFNKKEDRRLKGKIRKLIRERGFGFIAAEDSKDVFFHRSALAGEAFDALKEGDSVDFNLERVPKGLQAMNVRVDDLFRKQERGESMQAYCLKCRAKREIKDPKTITMKNGRPATQGTCLVCGTKMFRLGKAFYQF